ncbi:MAG TPA: DUF3450 domain-containing protein [Nevskiales bacterium]|nr:DUF3450 domain-containing protein [Nevskiales bacterium]
MEIAIAPVARMARSYKRASAFVGVCLQATLAGASRIVMALLLVVLLLPALAADSANPAIELLVQAHQEAAKSQARIDKLDDDMRRMRDEMRRGVLQLESLKTDLPALERHAGEQAARRAQLERELSAGVPGQIEVAPALQQMVAWLDRFVQADAPFRLDQRRQRIAGLKALLAKPDVPDADKLRAVLEVTQVELQYGRSVEAYTGQLRFGGKDQDVEFLRVGRVMLYYLEPEGARQGYWDRSTRRWQPLPAEERERLEAALDMARGETPPELMELLLPAPGAGS